MGLLIRENRQFEDVGLNSGNNLLKSSNVRCFYLKMICEHKQIFIDVTIEFTDGRPRVAACDNELNNSKLERLH